MATNFAPSLYQAPLGIDAALDSEAPEVEIEIVNPEGVTIGVDGVEIDLLPENEPESFGANLAEWMSENELASLGSELSAQIDEDINSRKDWVKDYVKGLEVLGLTYEERTEPWIGASGVYSSVLAEAAIRFQSETIMETFPASGPVKTEIIGEETPANKEAAIRVAEDMNFEITEGMPEYRPEHERMLFSLGLAGAAFKKVYEDTSLGRQTAIFVPAEDIIIPYGATSAQTAPRVTHIMRKTKNEIRKLQVAGFYRDVDLGDPVRITTDIEKQKADIQGYSVTDDDRYQLLEIQAELDLPGYEDPDGIALPYIITLDKGTDTVLSIYRNWNEDDETKTKRQHLVQYTYIPGFGAYGLGLINLIGGYARAGTSIIRELVDAGQLSNLPGGMKTKGLRVKGDDTPIAPGEFRDVDVASGTLRDNIMPLPYKEPSQVLLALCNQLTEEARRLGAISDMNISDMSANAPVGTVLALLERTLKTMSAVQARVHYSMKQEFKLLAALIRDHAPEEYSYTPQGAGRSARKSDYSMVEVIPVSDPNSSTMAQRIMQYQAALQLAQGAPQIYDLPVLHRQMLEVLGIKNAAKLVPIPDDMTPRDPISENMAFLTGKPTKAFIYQDHDAHIATHTAMMQDPMVMGQIGQNPQAQGIQASIMAHVAEHVAFQYRAKVQEQLGATLPAPDTEMPPEVEVQLSKLVAQAAQQLLTLNKGQAAAQQAQQMQQDPMIQMQMQELQIKAKKVDGELALAQQELQLKAQEMALRSQQSAPQQAQAQMAIQAQQTQQQLALQAEQARQQMAIQAQQASQQAQIKAAQAQQQMQLKAQQAAQAAALKEQQAAQSSAAKQQAVKTKKEAK